jgi:ABC-type antimicrobial peptide transport system permease subunit
VAASAPRRLEDVIAAATAPRRLAVGLLAVFAGAALLLAAAGLGASVAASVTQRTREIGVRMALGGTARSVVATLVAAAARLVAAGVALGGAGAWIVGRLIPSGPDVPALAVAAGLLSGVGLVAAWLPARRAARIDPACALRAE